MLKELKCRVNGGSIVKLLVFHGGYNVISITLQRKKKKKNEFQQLSLLSFREYEEIRYVAENGQDLLPVF